MPKRISRSEAEAWLATNCPRYRILSWPEKAGDKCHFIDDARGVEFRYRFSTFKTSFVNRGTIFCASVDEIKQKRENTNLRKYGFKHAIQSQEIKFKQENAILEKYGVKNISHVPEVREKVLKTTLQRHGYDCALKDPEARKKIQQTNLERYGGKSPANSRETTNKAAQTSFERYGFVKNFSSKEFREQVRNTMLAKYGCDSPSRSSYFNSKRIETNIKKYGSSSPLGNSFVARKMLDTKIFKGLIKTYNGKTLSEIAKHNLVSPSYIVRLSNKVGTNCESFIDTRRTAIESIVCNILNKNNFSFVFNKKLGSVSISVKPDFYLADSKLIIECDGLYWHCEKFDDSKKPSTKKKAYSDSGLNSLFFYEDEILNKPQIVESMILNKAGKLSLAFSARDRQLRLQKLAGPECKEFLDSNHIMGAGKGAGYCLVDEAGLILACMQIARKGDGISISRFCSRTFCSVRGAFGKLLKFAIADTNPAFVETFIDQRYGTGSYLPSFGFEQKTCYPSFYWTDFESRFHRLNFRGNTGYEAGLVKIWDCGQAKWVKICRNE